MKEESYADVSVHVNKVYDAEFHFKCHDCQLGTMIDDDHIEDSIECPCGITWSLVLYAKGEKEIESVKQ